MKNKSRPGTNPGRPPFKAPSVGSSFVRFVDKVSNKTYELHIKDVNGWSAAMFGYGKIHCEAIFAMFASPVHFQPHH